METRNLRTDLGNFLISDEIHERNCVVRGFCKQFELTT